MGDTGGLSFAAWSCTRAGREEMVVPLVWGLSTLLLATVVDTPPLVVKDGVGGIVAFCAWTVALRRCDQESVVRYIGIFACFFATVRMLSDVKLMEPPADPKQPFDLAAVSRMMQLLLQSGVVLPSVLVYGSLPYTYVNALGAVSTLRFVYLSRGHGGGMWVLIHVVGLIVGYVSTRLHRRLYEKEMELLAAREDLARLLEASREANERREYEILTLGKKLERVEEELHAGVPLSEHSGPVGSHHTAKVGQEQAASLWGAESHDTAKIADEQVLAGPSETIKPNTMRSRARWGGF